MFLVLGLPVFFQSTSLALPAVFMYSVAQCALDYFFVCFRKKHYHFFLGRPWGIRSILGVEWVNHGWLRRVRVCVP